MGADGGVFATRRQSREGRACNARRQSGERGGMVGISVVIPVYNAEAHVGKCIRSVMRQTLGDLEIIVIDDGSTDRSRTVCERYAGMDARITVASQENRGVSAARNLGIRMAAGKYVMFVDGDDAIGGSMCADLYRKAEGGGWPLVMTGYRQVDVAGDGTFERRIPVGVSDIDTREKLAESYRALFENRAFLSCCMKLFRRDAILENGVWFREGFSIGEDFLFLHEYLLAIPPRIGIAEGCPYRYYVRAGESLTRRRPESRIDTALRLFDRSREIYRGLGIEEAGVPCMARYCARTAVIVLGGMGGGRERKAAFNSACAKMDGVLPFMEDKMPEERLYRAAFRSRSYAMLCACIGLREAYVFARSRIGRARPPRAGSGRESGGAPFFSIVVPVYNVGGYLEECVGSVLSQDFSDYEVILVDDGSEDSSGSICDSFASRDARVRHVRKSNGGLSSARNHGMRLARGEYLVFLDGDDWLLAGALSSLREKIKSCRNPDVVVCPYVTYDEEKKELSMELAGDYGVRGTRPARVFRKLFLRQNIPPMAWTLVCRREYVMGRGLLFKEGLLHEDELWTPQALLGASEAVVARRPAYAYRVNRGGSIMASMGGRNLRCKVYIIRKLLSLSRDPGMGRDASRCLRDRCARLLWGILDSEYVQPGPSGVRDGWLEGQIEPLLPVLRDAEAPRYRVAYAWIRLFGLESLRKMGR